ncbi:hypothetical protein ADUPG1_006862 [Aduncisulcus paluster]|uniref:Rab-GAP TBC domain-containing protein n=1 Tax=Aduncisulcus paluster TaxID=2918883 RepID=A0ABQ5KLI7_9EUKA|nr:hypothetical protein ADUPG1_006862 [Aduncisulcus paluster]
MHHASTPTLKKELKYVLSCVPPLPAQSHPDRYGFISTEEEESKRCFSPSTPAGSGKSLDKDTKQSHCGSSKKSQANQKIQQWADIIFKNDKFWFHEKQRNKLKTIVRQGVPSKFRGVFWQRIRSSDCDFKKYCESRDIKDNIYWSKYLVGSNPSAEITIIKDIGRTFPQNVFLVGRRHMGMEKLFRLLKAYSIHDRETGYCQGMGFIASVFLMYMSEEEAFWLFVRVLESMKDIYRSSLRGVLERQYILDQLVAHHFPDLIHDRETGYCQGMGFIASVFLMYMSEEEAFWLFVRVLESMKDIYRSSLRGVLERQYILDQLVAHHFPDLSAHLKELDIESSFFAAPWFMTLFTSTLPFSLVVRVLDCFMVEGEKILYRVALMLLKEMQKGLKDKKTIAKWKKKRKEEEIKKRKLRLKEQQAIKAKSKSSSPIKTIIVSKTTPDASISTSTSSTIADGTVPMVPDSSSLTPHVSDIDMLSAASQSSAPPTPMTMYSTVQCEERHSSGTMEESHSSEDPDGVHVIDKGEHDCTLHDCDDYGTNDEVWGKDGISILALGFEGTIRCLQNFPRQCAISPDIFIDKIFKVSLSRKEINKYRKEYELKDKKTKKIPRKK